MVVADVLEPNRCQAISNQQFDLTKYIVLLGSIDKIQSYHMSALITSLNDAFMMAADVLAPNRCQAISNHHFDSIKAVVSYESVQTLYFPLGKQAIRPMKIDQVS